ncbi:hypothetical protein [Rhizobium aethiopicum]|uniref:hypothetical protein n=1 Tax=Rhizobium aethiopicum TaxID=1138170 RepID=UPI001FD9FECC|nr:hypothetical protein [Rhizobium aethiopicum]
MREPASPFDAARRRLGLIGADQVYTMVPHFRLGGTLSQLSGVFRREDVADIQASGYPGGAVIPWAAEDLHLYDLDTLQEHQVGYRIDAKGGSASAGWPDVCYVFADASANPFVPTSDGAVHFTRHGAGSSRFERIADDLPTFIEDHCGMDNVLRGGERQKHHGRRFRSVARKNGRYWHKSFGEAR